MDMPVYARQRAVVEAHGLPGWRPGSGGRPFYWYGHLSGAWIWYAFFASHPRVIYSENLPHGDRARFYQFLAPNQVLSIKASQMSLFDVAQQRQLWSVPLNVGIFPAAPTGVIRAGIEEESQPLSRTARRRHGE